MDKRLAAIAFSTPAKFADPASDGTRRFSGVAYGGGIITDHGWFNRVAFDLSTTTFATPAPVLLAHDDPIGVVDKAEVNGEIRVEGNLFADVQGPAMNVAAMADRGMPWQLSVYIKPGSVEEFKAGAKIKLNGRTFDGPLTVFRNSRVREVSFCALGADDSTTAQVFNIGGDDPPRRREGDPMAGETIDKAEHDRIVGELNAKYKDVGDKLAAFEASAATKKREQRAAEVNELFKSTGRKFDDAAAKPYLEMADDVFPAIAADLKARPKHDPKLFSAQAIDGAPEDGAPESDAIAIQRKAHAFRTDFKAKHGYELSIVDAVAHVTGKRTIA